MIELIERDFESFFKAPFNVYGNTTPYVSPMKSDLARFLSSRTNPLFDSEDDFTYFTALENNKPIGRITAHIHKASNTLYETKQAYFGFFDCIENQEIASRLLYASEAWARAKGLEKISGNFNLTAMQQIGVQTGGFANAPYTDQIWGPPYLPELLEQNGYEQHFPMTTFELDIRGLKPEQILSNENENLIKDSGFTFAPVNRRTLDARLEDARNILNESFIDNPMFVPVTKEEFDFQAKEMKWIMDPRISTIMHKDGEVAGAVIAIPDLNPMLKAMGSKLGLSAPWHFLKHRLNRKRAVVIFQGVRPQFQGMGVNPIMLAHILVQMQKASYEKVGGTWIADENKASIRQTEKSGAKALHRLHLYSKALN